ncbi:MAG: undecaprenyl-diphosphate phosphatase [Clostridia bacterium]|nr:undecaprenyl-diphosphate phosphatase [Clostridia bacterium]
MSVWQAILVGIIQGLTEFLPVSSSGHILLVSRLIGVEPSLSFTLILHVATLLSVVIAMRKEIADFLRSKDKWGKIILATLCSLVVIFGLKGLLSDALDGKFLGISFLLTAALLIVSGFAKPTKDAVGYLDAAIIGCVQGLAAAPGISRSGSTISTAMLVGVEKKASVSFSFLLSIPIIIGSATLDLITHGVGSISVLPLAIGFISAFAAGTVAVKIMKRLTAAINDAFAVYLIALSILVAINDLFLHLF